jgi:hypothetical protein
MAYAANSSSNAFASFRSRVSNPSVNHPYTGANSSRALTVTGPGEHWIAEPVQRDCYFASS